MKSRETIVGGNWKMNTTLAGAPVLAEGVARAVPGGVSVAVFPPFPFLLPVRDALARAGAAGRVALGAQDAYFEPKGAFTGEVSLDMLRECGVTLVLAGHSERRHVLGESDELVGRKASAILAAGMRCVLCIGETLAERESGRTQGVNERQLRAGLRGVGPSNAERLVIAYEPVWAIGTGKAATPTDAREAHGHIRSVLGELLGGTAAERTPIMYGGSVTAANAASLMAQPDVDGALVGGASLKVDEFSAICAAAAG
ncbi:MAG: triose-phosphate isomerase [Phycisphaerae bacterium]|nr:triose-phosphate isomerase [Phycisphaerae bacterium]